MLVPNDGEQRTLTAIQDQRKQGLSLREIARCLEEQGIPTQAGANLLASSDRPPDTSESCLTVMLRAKYDGPLRTIGKEIASEIMKYFEAVVAPETITMRLSRMQQGVTNVTPNQVPLMIQEFRKNRQKKGGMHKDGSSPVQRQDQGDRGNTQMGSTNVNAVIVVPTFMYDPECPTGNLQLLCYGTTRDTPSEARTRRPEAKERTEKRW